ncbi:acyltransferase [Blastococcus xanthinilyticus]|uniref:Acyl-[acyl carrier protein]--UDP-N-acetylglucosamine O-acyltransferase n=1 Tax=Blastococcus xanthinilyticus TaxID=1564164 RepID=A0A5S5D568_9ACTN|nr:acyltransferase [Blastococcus xanthinilyticus]TYP89819.1 acyl-[acyl carrier protein]--UDP-N-acetylglucosamine O-acyltransferase [Blastococcus xanthinilyticus]
MIHPTAIVDPAARLGEGVEIGPFSIVHADVELGAGTVVGSHCELGHPAAAGDVGPLRVGAGALIRSHSVLYAGSTFGDQLQTGHRVTLREGIEAAEDLRIGTLCDLQGDATFGRHVRLHSNVHIGRGSTVGEFVWIFPYVVLTNDPHPPSDGFHVGATIERFAVVATSSVVLPGVRVGEGSLVAAHALVRQDVPPGAICAGVPGKIRGEVGNIDLVDGSGPAYPWRRHFHRGYPEDVVQGWIAEFDASNA